MSSHSRADRLTNIFFLVITLAGITLIVTQFDQVEKTLRYAEWQPVIGALLATGLSYLSMSLSFALVGRLLDLEIELRDLALIGFVTNVINHVITTAGVAGYSLRYLLMKRHNILFKDTFAVSILHFYLTSLDMLVMFPVSIAYLITHAPVSRQVATILSLLTVVLAFVALFAALLIFAHTWRERLLRLAGRVVSRILQRDLDGQLDQLDESMDRGVLAIRRSPGQLAAIMGLTWIDWLGSVFVLSYCLDAFGPAVPFGVVVTGFVLGVMSGLISMVPGGLGIQEGSMTGVFTLLGVPFGQAFLAAILFRAIFFFLPYVISLGFSRWLLKPGELLDTSATK